MRDGFLVTSNKKKLWNVQIGLINEFARICQKHNLRWFAIGGTLLGAARHKGFLPSVKIRDSRTTMIEFSDRNFVNQSIWIDIFPLDFMPPFTQEKQALNFEIARTFLAATIFPQMMKNAIQNKEKIIINYKDLENFLAFSYKERGALFDSFMIESFIASEYVNNFFSLYHFPDRNSYRTEFFSDVIYLPFEKIELPVPADYDNVLKTFYGDWRTPIFYPPHVLIYSAEISWREYFQKATFK